MNFFGTLTEALEQIFSFREHVWMVFQDDAFMTPESSSGMVVTGSAY